MTRLLCILADKICESSEDASVHPHETDCTKFYECSHGQAAELTCPNGLHFNPKEGVCDWPEFAGCTTKTA